MQVDQIEKKTLGMVMGCLHRAQVKQRVCHRQPAMVTAATGMCIGGSARAHKSNRGRKKVRRAGVWGLFDGCSSQNIDIFY